MERILNILLVIALILVVCLFKYLLHKQGQELTTEKGKTNKEEGSIMGKCRYEMRHSKPLIPSYSKSKASDQKESIFAPETKSGQSADDSEGREKEELLITTGIDEVPLNMTAEESLTLDNEEEKTIPRSTESEAEYARGVDAEKFLYAMSVIGNPNATTVDKRVCSTLLPLLENTVLMSKLQSNEIFAQRIEDIIRSNYAEPIKAKVADDNTLMGGLIDFEKLLNVKESKR